MALHTKHDVVRRFPARHAFLCVILVCGITMPVCGQQREESHGEFVKAIARPSLEKVPDLEAVSNKIVALTNEFRRREGLQETRGNKELKATCQYFADFMAREDKYGHTADGKRPSERAKEQGYEFCIVLENIAYQFHSSGFQADQLAAAFTDGWKNSPEHRANMLDPDISETAVAVGLSPSTGYFYAVQMFGRPKTEAIQFEITNRSGVTVYYRVAEKKFPLEARYTRIHELCRPSKVEFFGTSEDRQTPLASTRPDTGAVLVVAKDQSGNPTLKSAR